MMGSRIRKGACIPDPGQTHQLIEAALERTREKMATVPDMPFPANHDKCHRQSPKDASSEACEGASD